MNIFMNSANDLFIELADNWIIYIKLKLKILRKKVTKLSIVTIKNVKKSALLLFILGHLRYYIFYGIKVNHNQFSRWSNDGVQSIAVIVAHFNSNLMIYLELLRYRNEIYFQH